MPRRDAGKASGKTYPEPIVQLSAFEDLDAIAQRLMRVSGAVSAEATVNGILDSIGLLGPSPYLGPIHQDPVLARFGYRKLISGKYVVVYRVEDNRAIVLRVFHGSADYIRLVGE